MCRRVTLLLICIPVILTSLTACGNPLEDDEITEQTATPDDVMEIVTPTVRATVTPRVDFAQYTVQEGDTLLDIAILYGVTSDEIIAANDLSNPNAIFAGQVLRIPPPPATPVP